MNNGFNKEGFMSWLKEEFPGVIDTHWNYDLVENIIDYALENKNASKDQLAFFISDMLPEVEYTEVAKFCDKDILSDFTLEFLKQLK